MNVTKSAKEISETRWADPSLKWGLVPTMGYLHQGHLSLIQKARQQNDRVGVSIFVNPIQFNNTADLKTYPRNIERDLELLKKENVDLVWSPDSKDVYPDGFQTFVNVEKITQFLEGAARPNHFKGVTTVVAKLFNVFQPNRAYFGQKDAQQVAVVKRMVTDLNFNIEIVTCPTIRETDGLAMSSRNSRLTKQARQQAICLFEALQLAKQNYESGERRADIIRSKMKQVIRNYDKAKIDYISVAHIHSLEELEIIEAGALISLAVFIDDIRLIDNIIV